MPTYFIYKCAHIAACAQGELLSSCVSTHPSPVFGCTLSLWNNNGYHLLKYIILVNKGQLNP